MASTPLTLSSGNAPKLYTGTSGLNGHRMVYWSGANSPTTDALDLTSALVTSSTNPIAGVEGFTIFVVLVPGSKGMNSCSTGWWNLRQIVRADDSGAYRILPARKVG